VSAQPLAPLAPAADRPADPGGRDHEDEPMTFKRRAARVAQAALDPLAGGLARAGVRADHLSAIGLVLSLGAGLAFFEGWFRPGALLAALAGLCDVLDGQVARRSGVRSRFGAFLDSTLDRASEGMMLAGLAGFYIINLVELALDPMLVAQQVSRGLEPRTWAAVALTAVVALVGSFMVSYTRARAEGLGLDCKVGWFERPERLALVIVAGLFGVGPVMPGALLVLAILSFATATQRVVHVWKNTRAAGRDS
jgi:CDP-diacylglycerol--glycerol-3-phosphate 3-phosphatidyltransferase